MYTDDRIKRILTIFLHNLLFCERYNEDFFIDKNLISFMTYFAIKKYINILTSIINTSLCFHLISCNLETL